MNQTTPHCDTASSNPAKNDNDKSESCIPKEVRGQSSSHAEETSTAGEPNMLERYASGHPKEHPWSTDRNARRDMNGTLALVDKVMTMMQDKKED